MPLFVASQPSQTSDSPMTLQENVRRTPLRPILGTIRSPSSTGRPPLAEKRVMSPLSKAGTVEVEEEKPRYPTATIDAESISDVMAARLTTCLLGHVLFLKSQVPFPVAQLIKMAASQGPDDRPNKKLDKLLAAFDLLSSHLGSTFTSLASAFAAKYYGSSDAETSEKVHLVIVLGPTATAVNAARARVVLEISNLRVASRFTITEQPRPCIASNRCLKEDEGVIRPGSAPKGPGPLSEQARGLRDVSEGPEFRDASSKTSDEDELDSSIVEHPPDSDCDSYESETESSYASSEPDSGADADFSEDDTREETEADLSAAERSLSRTLAIANADPELGMAADIRPTQIHILLHAPRRFSHPSWIPRQGMARDMDPLLKEFDEPPTSSSAALQDITNGSLHSGKSSTKPEVRRKGPGGIKTDYVCIQSRDASSQSPRVNDAIRVPSESDDGKVGETESDVEEDDSEAEQNEMIWWSWEGRLEGFTDL